MILIKNKQTKIKINTNKIKKTVEQILQALHYPNFDIGIWFTTNQTIKKYNKKYRKKNKPTDILSFPFHTNIKPGQKPKILTNDDKNLGDIIISLELCKKDAQSLNTSLFKYLQIIIIHGIAHLLGYKHKTDEQYKLMKQFEEKILKSISEK